MIDWARIEELREEVGDDSFCEVVSLFLEETDEAVARLAQSFDDDEIRGLLHFMKGSALNLGFSTLSRMCQSSGDDPPDLHRVVEVYRASRAELLRHPDGRRPF